MLSLAVSLLQVGDKLPDVAVYEGQPNNAVKLRDVFAGKKVLAQPLRARTPRATLMMAAPLCLQGVLLAVPGAFTPGCSKTHLPGYVSSSDKYKAAGADVIACIATNDPFVMASWGDSQGATGKVLLHFSGTGPPVMCRLHLHT
jgi:2-Cys peroxiredoxin 5